MSSVNHKLFAGIAILICLQMLASCATQYRQPSSNEPHSSFRFLKSYGRDPSATMLSQGRHQYFYVLPDQGCSDPEVVAGFHTGAIGNSETKRITATDPVRILGYINVRDVPIEAYVTGSTAKVQKSACISFAQFVPESGATYEVSMDLRSMEDCELHIVDASTHEVPVGIARSELCSAEQSSELVDFLLKSKM